MPLTAYPEVERYLDPSEDFTNSAEEKVIGDQTFLIVRQVSDAEGNQILFRKEGQGWQMVHPGGILDLGDDLRAERQVDAALVCSRSSAQDHARFIDYVESKVNVFSSADGPDHGNLACVWTVRHLAYEALNRWITRVDGTAPFSAELRRCYAASPDEGMVPAGGLIISPTVERPDGSRNIGHVGILGAGQGENRLIYSNSSGRARLEQNFTLGSWQARYATRKGLRVLYFSLPRYDRGVVA